MRRRVRWLRRLNRCPWRPRDDMRSRHDMRSRLQNGAMKHRILKLAALALVAGASLLVACWVVSLPNSIVSKLTGTVDEVVASEIPAAICARTSHAGYWAAQATL